MDKENVLWLITNYIFPPKDWRIVTTEHLLPPSGHLRVLLNYEHLQTSLRIFKHILVPLDKVLLSALGDSKTSFPLSLALTS